MNSILLSCAVTLVIDLDIAGDFQWWILGAATFPPQFMLVPRFILSLRALYAHDVQGRGGSDIDTAFGLGSSSGHDAAGSTIVFASGGQNEEEEQGEEHVEQRREGQGEEIQMEEKYVPSVGSSA